MSEIIRRLHAAYQAARRANIDMREWRLSTTAHDELIASREAQSLWSYDTKDGEQRRTLMGVAVVIVVEDLPEAWESPTLDLRGDEVREVPHPVAVCMSGIGKRGRWEYFDA